MQADCKPEISQSHYQPPLYAIERQNDRIVGISPRMVKLFSEIDNLASKPATVLIRGETGTGKGLVAKALHYNGRKNGEFVHINCTAMPSDLLESELFGHKQGAFTGAVKDTKGAFVEANGGTLFLDEIGDMHLHLQAKILQAIEEKRIRPVGGSYSDVPNIDVRIIGATHKNMEEEVRNGRFRRDLYYRTNVLSLDVPPLRERKEDIDELVKYITEKLDSAYGAKVEDISAEVIDWFRRHDWPGNVRELRNLLERGFAKRNGDQIEMRDLELTLDTSITSIVSTDTKRRWFDYGVYPTVPRRLEDTPGSINAKGILKLLSTGCVNSLPVGGITVLFLTPDSAGLFFRRRTVEFDRILEEMREGRFSRMAQKPFAIMSRQKLTEFIDSYHYITSFILQQTDLYKIGSRLFVIGEDDRELVYKMFLHAPRSLGKTDSVRRTDNFFTQMHEAYERDYVSWKPAYSASRFN